MDIQNVYLNVETKEKILLYAEDYCKSDQGEVVVIVRSLYGLKSSALAWYNNLTEVLRYYMGFTHLLTYPGIWFKA